MDVQNNLLGEIEKSCESNAKYIPYLTVEQINTLVSKNLLDLSSPLKVFRDWIFCADSIDNDGNTNYTIEHILDIFRIYLNSDSKMILDYRTDENESIITLIFTSSVSCNTESFMIEIMTDFLHAGFDFSNEYRMMWDAVRGSNSDVVRFLLRNGMTIESCISKNKNGDNISDIPDCCINEGLDENIKFLSGTEIGRTDYRLCYATIKVLTLFDYPIEQAKFYTTKRQNPYWDWSNDFKS